MIVSSPQGNVTTPNPQLGNAEVLNTRATFLRSMSGVAYSYKTNPSSSTFNLQIDGMTRIIAQDLLTLIHNTLAAGQLLTFTYGTEVHTGNLDMQSVSISNDQRGKSISLTINKEN